MSANNVGGTSPNVQNTSLSAGGPSATTTSSKIEDYNNDNPLPKETWDALSKDDKLATLEKWCYDSGFEDTFTNLTKDSDFVKFVKENGFYLSDGLGKYDKDTFKMTQMLEDAGFTVMMTDEPDSKKATVTFGSGNDMVEFKLPAEYDSDGNCLNPSDLITKEKYDKLSSTQQEKLYQVWNLNPIAELVIDDDLGDMFQNKSLSFSGAEYTIPNQIPSLPKPSGKTMSLTELIGTGTDGKLSGNASVWAMGLMSMINSTQLAQSKHIANTMEQSMAKDNYYFEKAKIVNKKMYQTIAAQNKKIVDNHNLQAEKKNFGQRFLGIFKKFFTGDIGGAFKEAVSLVYDCTIGLVQKVIKTLVSGVTTIVFLCQRAHFQNTGELDKVKEMDAKLKQVGESLKDEWTFTKTEYDNEAIKQSMAESEALEREMNTLTAEEAQYVNLSELGFMDMVNETSQSMTGTGMKVLNGFVGAIGMVAGFFSGGIFGVFGAIQNMEQMEQVQQANAYAAESMQQNAMLQFRSSQVDSVKQIVSAFREELSAGIDLLGKDLEMMLEFLAGMEEMINDLIGIAMEMEANAAKGGGAA